MLSFVNEGGPMGLAGGQRGDLVTAINGVSMSSLTFNQAALIEGCGGREGTFRLPVGDAVRSFPSIDVVGEQVWGLTWRVLDDLLDQLGIRQARR